MDQPGTEGTPVNGSDDEVMYADAARMQGVGSSPLPSSLSPGLVRAWLGASCALQGVAVQVSDPGVIAEVVALLGGADTAGHRTAATRPGGGGRQQNDTAPATGSAQGGSAQSGSARSEPGRDTGRRRRGGRAGPTRAA